MQYRTTQSLQRSSIRFLCCLLVTLAVIPAGIAQTAAPSFKIIPLGVRGGLDESNLSAYMVAPEGSNDYVCLDAGTLYAGLKAATEAGLFQEKESERADQPPKSRLQDPGYILKHYIKAYLISHGHLDHVAGLIIGSPEDTAKTIFGLPSTLTVLRERYFTWEGWANFADAGEKPTLNKYHYSSLVPGQIEKIANTDFYVTPYVLSHVAPYQSTAFLLKNNENYLLYLGDTGADTLEHSDKLHLLWQAVAPLIKDHRLKGIMIETSFPDEQPAKLLFGHLTPALLMSELQDLEQLTGPGALKDFPILVTHIKPSGDQITLIKKELEAANTLQVKLIFPAQAHRLDL